MKPLLPLALFLLACSADPAAAAPPQKTPPAKTSAVAPKAEEAPIFDPIADGEMTLAHYKSVCEQSNRRLLLLFGTNDCRPCRVVNKAIHDPKFLRPLLKQFVPAFVDVTPGTANAGLPPRYGIDPKAPLPGVVIFDSKHNVTEALKNGEMAAVASGGPEAVQLWILQRFERSTPN